MINATKLDSELKAAGLPIVGCASTGRIDWDGEPTEAQKTRAQAILAAHDPAPVDNQSDKKKLAQAAKKAKTFEELQAALVAFAEA